MELCSYLVYYKHFVLGDIDLFNRQIQSGQKGSYHACQCA